MIDLNLGMEVWRDACAKYEDAAAAGNTIRDGVLLGDDAAAAVIQDAIAKAVADLQAEVEELRGALSKWEAWEAKVILDGRCWANGEWGCQIPQDLFDEYVCGPQSARQALARKENCDG